MAGEIASTKRNAAATTDELAVAAGLAARLDQWYHTNGRTFAWRGWRDTYRLATIEILLQRTRAEVVESFALSFYAAYPNWTALASATESELALILRPIGLHHRRASALLALADRMVAGESVGLHQPGVGQYVHRAIRVARDGERLAMIDSNFIRVASRVFGGPWMAEYRNDARLQALGQAIVDPALNPAHVNWAILDLGAIICTPREPRCDVCPIAPSCRYAGERES